MKRTVTKRGKRVTTRSGREVKALAKHLVSLLRPLSTRIKLAGSIRRGNPNPIDIDIVLIPKNKDKIIKKMSKLGTLKQHGEKKASFRISGVKTELYYTTPQSWGATLLAYSSEKGAAIGLRIIAKKKGFKLNQYGLHKGKTLVAGKTEYAIYKVLGRPYKSPRNR